MQEELGKAVPLLESIGRAEAPSSLRALTFADLAVAYAHLGRVEDEIAAYGKALEVQPVAFERSRLFANRAEAYMLLGNIIAAVEGYRAALSLLSADHMMFGTGPTTLWGLGVALNRWATSTPGSTPSGWRGATTRRTSSSPGAAGSTCRATISTGTRPSATGRWRARPRW